MDINFTDILRQAQNVQGLMKDMQETLGRQTFTGESGGGMVSIRMNGKFEILEIKLDPICVDNRDVPMLEDLITAALNQAMQKVRENLTEEIKKAAGGLPIPPGLF